MPLNLYNTVIQQLKQQKHELQVQSQAEQHRARTSENFSQAVLSNLSCGVLVFGANGLVKTSNPAAKAILGFGSVNGMSAGDIFRGGETYPSRRLDAPWNRGLALCAMKFTRCCARAASGGKSKPSMKLRRERSGFFR